MCSTLLHLRAQNCPTMLLKAPVHNIQPAGLSGRQHCISVVFNFLFYSHYS